MSMRFLTTSAVILMIAGPAFADCSQEIEKSQRGGDRGRDRSEYRRRPDFPQQSIRSRCSQAISRATRPHPAPAVRPRVPASPHQEQALAEPAAGKAASGQQAADLVAQASDMAAAGNEEGCMQKVAEAKDLLGID